MAGKKRAPPRPSSVAKGPETQPVEIDVGQFEMMPYLGVLTYPRPDLEAAKTRLAQLRELGVKRILFEGKTKVGRLGLVGMGTVSVVVKAHGDEGEGGEEEGWRALKIRRIDANRESMLEEFRLTQLANRVGVGAELYGCTHDFITMQYVGGKGVEEYVAGLSGRGTAANVREMAHALLNQCRKLDLLGLDHGQLSDLRKHVILAERTGIPCIIDFESGSQNRPTKNVTTAAQYLFVGSRLSTRIKRVLGMKSSDQVLEALRRYRKDQSDENYARLLATFGLLI